jgi:L-cysteine desulfidase
MEGDKVNKEKYLKIALDNLTTVFSEQGAKATIEVMAKLKLKETSDVSEDLKNSCNMILYERVKMLKGESIAAPFFKLLKATSGSFS